MTNHGLTEEAAKDRDLWRNLVWAKETHCTRIVDVYSYSQTKALKESILSETVIGVYILGLT